jgi:uncharacterized caspase-like protein
MRTARLVCALLIIVVCCRTADAASEKRVALVIGSGRYQNVPALTNPANDARLMAAALEKLDFDVQTVIDPDYDTMKQALRDFGRRLDGARVALFYYAGHGLQVGGENYLLPVDAALVREPDLRYEAFDVQAILDEMDGPGRVNLVFLDACRDNPFARSLAARLGGRSTNVIHQGLAEIQSQASGTLIAYATAPGSVANDGEGKNSPFTAALARHLGDPGEEVRQMLTRVRVDVSAATAGNQRPWVAESIDSDFYFVPITSQSAAPARDPVPAPAPASAEIVFWQSIAGSTNPADFEAYLKQFPNGIFVALARVRLAALSARSEPAPAADEASWSDAQRRSVQSALTSLGYYRGPLNGVFDPDTRAAILRWQAFEGRNETGHLDQAHADTVIRDAAREAALLRVPEQSPRGTAADAARGAEARFNKGGDFENGTGQPKDLAEAAYWYALAARDGWAAAYTNLGTLYARGLGVPRDAEAARLLWLTAAASGEGTAMFNLGVLNEKGLGGKPADAAAAKRWYARGAERKHTASTAALHRLGG